MGEDSFMSTVSTRRKGVRRQSAVVAAIALGVSSLVVTHADAEAVKVGIVKSTMVGDARIAVERGYFEKEGLQVELVDFESAQPVAVATASGDIDFGSVGLTGGFYSLAGQGLLKIVSGGTRDVAGYQLGTYLVSNAAYDAGLHAFKDLANKKIAVTQIGSPYHYSLALGAAKYGIDLRGLQVTAVQSVPNEVSAIIGNKVDAALIPVPAALPLVNRGQAHLLGYTGDQAPWQFSIVFTATKIVTSRPEMIGRFLKALQRGGQDYHDAFSGPKEERKDGPTAAATEELLAKSSKQPLEQIKLSISYLDPQGRLDTRDVANQIAWYRDQGMIKTQFGVDDIVDSRFAKPLSTP
jgi:NitT/TauT family transport system substrate-binding protein